MYYNAFIYITLITIYTLQYNYTLLKRDTCTCMHLSKMLLSSIVLYTCEKASIT